VTSARILRLVSALSLLVVLSHPVAGQDAAPFGCPMHPELRAQVPGNCPRCGMALVRMGPLGTPPYRVALQTMPSDVRSGENVSLRFTITDPKTGKPVTDLTIVHDMPFHLFIVSEDLAYYDHIHPAVGADGAFVVDTSFPSPATYNLFCDFLPAGGLPQVVHLKLTTTDVAPGLKPTPVRLTPDSSLTKTVDGIRFELTMEPPRAAAGKATAFIYHLVDVPSGLPVTNLEPYLGAWGHTLILSEDAERYLHCHPTQLLPPGVDRAGLSGGPEVAFNATLRQPGRHRLWSQFKRGGKVTTVSFTIDVASVDHLAAWNGADWSQLGGGASAGPDGTVRALSARGSELFAGGDFQTAGGEAARGIARWDGRRWRALSGGVDGSVRAIAIAGSDVYVGGEFTTAGGVAAAAIARWDGRAWSPLGRGLTGSRDAVRPAAVYALAVRGKELYVGGRFITAGGVEANGLARWDGARFTALSGGVKSGDYDGIVWALTFFRGDLYVGGQFLTAGQVAARNIARWDGNDFHPVGDGVAGGLERVSALAAGGNRLFVGGDFTMAGGLGVGQLAAWDGERWQGLGVRTSESVRAITGRGTDVYVAGGTFSTAEGLKTNGIVRWNGSVWSQLGPGIASGVFLAPVLAIAPAGPAVYVGGGPFIVR